MSATTADFMGTQLPQTVTQFRVLNQSMSDGMVQFSLLDDAPAGIYVLHDYFQIVTPDDADASITINVNWTDDVGHAVTAGITVFNESNSITSVGGLASGSVDQFLCVTYSTTIRCTGGTIQAVIDPGGIGVNDAVVNWTGALVRVA